MLLKEKGYDEFLAQEIAIGLSESKAGLGIPAEEAKREILAMLEERAREEYLVGDMIYA